MRGENLGAHIIFSPEVLRVGRAPHDNLHPSASSRATGAGTASGSPTAWSSGQQRHPGPPHRLRQGRDAIRLVANTSLALRVATSNELDMYAARHGLSTVQNIYGPRLDPRIGSNHDNPSFGCDYDCVPEKTRQLRANYQDVPQNLISAIVAANHAEGLVAHDIPRRRPSTLGINRLVTKEGSDKSPRSQLASGRAPTHQPGRSSRLT